MAEEKLVGRISHYYGKIGVGIIELSGKLEVGDKIHIVGTNADFEQSVDSLQVDLKDISSAGGGESVGIKLAGAVKEGSRVFLIQ